METPPKKFVMPGKARPAAPALPAARPLPKPKWTPPQSPELKKGGILNGKYEIQGLLGEGGYGEVYLARNLSSNQYCALKTFKTELMSNTAAREEFQKEALLWINLDKHPHIVSAHFVSQGAGRLFVQMEYIARDALGRVTLHHHISKAGGPLLTAQALAWAVQFCLGMEHARARGIKCHRDIKPSNILITKDGNLKISDFGLASAAEGTLHHRGANAGIGTGIMQMKGKARCGTIGYMPPEIYREEGSGIHSDIYSFGLVLWQMGAGSKVPAFFAQGCANWTECMNRTYTRQMSEEVPEVDEALNPIIRKCLRRDPRERYVTFEELRADLEPLLKEKGGATVEITEQEKTATYWANKAGSLVNLGQHQEAIRCCDQALEMDPKMGIAWYNKAVALQGLKKTKDAIACYDQALEIDPKYVPAWTNKGTLLSAMGLFSRRQALACFDTALSLEPDNARTWFKKGVALDSQLGRRSEAIACFDKTLELDANLLLAWYNKGIVQRALGKSREAMHSLQKFLQLARGLQQYAKQVANADRVVEAIRRNHG